MRTNASISILVIAITATCFISTQAAGQAPLRLVVDLAGAGVDASDLTRRLIAAATHFPDWLRRLLSA